MISSQWRHMVSMPDPHDTHPSTLRPTSIKHGLYQLDRRPYDTEVRLTEPDGDSYLLEFFECERFLRAVLKLSEVDTNRILDTAWGFCSAKFTVDNPEVVTHR